MGLISWIVFGALAGWLAHLVLGVKDEKQGCLRNTVIGVIGALIGGFLYRIVTGHGIDLRWDLRSMGVAVIGAIVLLMVTGRHKKRGE